MKTLLQELYKPFSKTHLKLVEYPEQHQLPYEHSNNNVNNGQNDEEDLWHPGNIKQEFDSAKTSLNQIPSSFKTIDMLHGWKPNSVNLDIGSGRLFKDEYGEDIHKFTIALKSKGVKNLGFDPFNRTFDHNTMVAQEIKQNGADTVTVNNVLNVIKEPENRNRVIKQAYSALKNGPDNYAYFLIYEGNRSENGSPTKIGTWQNNIKTASYMPEIHKYFPKVFKKGNLIIAQK